MEITIDMDEIVDEVINSSEIERAISDIVDEKVDGEISDRLDRLDIDDISDFERRVGEIVSDLIDAKVDDRLDSFDTRVEEILIDRIVHRPQGSTLIDTSSLIRRLAALEEQVTDLRQALFAASIVLAKGSAVPT